jgi:hypothetical protein
MSGRGLHDQTQEAIPAPGRKRKYDTMEEAAAVAKEQRRQAYLRKKANTNQTVCVPRQ